jgi:hypothetical protein
MFPSKLGVLGYDQGSNKHGVLRERLGVFDDSQEISDMLSDVDSYVTYEGAAHIDGLYVLAQEMMKHIKKLERKK